MDFWTSRLRVVDSVSGAPIQQANVRSLVGWGLTSAAGEVSFTFISDLVVYEAIVNKEGYNPKSQLVHQSSAGSVVTIPIERTNVGTSNPAPTGLRVWDWSPTTVTLRWNNPQSYSKVLVGWSHPPGAPHQQLPDLPGNAATATVSGSFQPGDVYDWKVKGYSSESGYTAWSLFQWKAPPWPAAGGFTEIGSSGAVPAGAKPAGREADGATLYVARAAYAGGMHPGKWRQGWTAAAISYGGAEVWVENAAVWTGMLSGGSDGIWLLPDSALNASPVGWEADQTTLFVARAAIEGGVHIGKWRRDWTKAAIPYGGQERWVSNFDVLCGT